MVPLDPFQGGGVKRTVELPTTCTGGTLRFAGTGMTGGCTGTVFSFLLLVLSSRWEEWLPLRAKIAIVFSIIRELRGPIRGRHMLPIGQGDVGSNVGIFDGFDVLGRSILGIASDVFGLYTPTEGHMPE